MRRKNWTLDDSSLKMLISSHVSSVCLILPVNRKMSIRTDHNARWRYVHVHAIRTCEKSPFSISDEIYMPKHVALVGTANIFLFSVLFRNVWHKFAFGTRNRQHYNKWSLSRGFKIRQMTCRRMKIPDTDPTLHSRNVLKSKIADVKAKSLLAVV